MVYAVVDRDIYRVQLGQVGYTTVRLRPGWVYSLADLRVVEGES